MLPLLLAQLAFAEEAAPVPPLAPGSALPAPTASRQPSAGALVVAQVGMGAGYVGSSMVVVSIPIALVAAFMCTDACSAGGTGLIRAAETTFGVGLGLVALGPIAVGGAELEAQRTLGGRNTLPIVAISAGTLATASFVYFGAAEQRSNVGLFAATGFLSAATGYVAGGVELGRLSAAADARVSARLFPTPGGLAVAGTF